MNKRDKEELALVVPSFRDEAVIGADGRERELCVHTENSNGTSCSHGLPIPPVLCARTALFPSHLHL